MPRAGFEPARTCVQGILSPRCLPVPPPGRQAEATPLRTPFIRIPPRWRLEQPRGLRHARTVRQVRARPDLPILCGVAVRVIRRVAAHLAPSGKSCDHFVTTRRAGSGRPLRSGSHTTSDAPPRPRRRTRVGWLARTRRVSLRVFGAGRDVACPRQP